MVKEPWKDEGRGAPRSPAVRLTRRKTGAPPPSGPSVPAYGLAGAYVCGGDGAVRWKSGAGRCAIASWSELRCDMAAGPLSAG